MIHLWQHLWLWFAIHTGTYNEPGPYYGFFSGFGSDITEVLLLGGIVQIYRRHNCVTKGCYRLGRHQVGNTHLKTCPKHTSAGDHAKLMADHKAKYPEAHKFLHKSAKIKK